MFYGILDMLGSKESSFELRKHEFWALKDISFQLRRGEVLGVLGKNGAGKTTLMRLVNGIFPVDKGTIETHGRIASVFEKHAGIHRLYSGRENIFIKGAMFRMSRPEITQKLDEIISFAGIEPHIDAPFGGYSSGMKAKLNISIALATEPDILILDEGLAVTDNEFKKKCYKKISEILPQTGIINISHDLKNIINVGTRTITIDQGKKVDETSDVKKGIENYLKRYSSSYEREESQSFLNTI